MESLQEDTPRIGQGEWPLDPLQGMGPFRIKLSLSQLVLQNEMMRLQHIFHKYKGVCQGLVP